MLFDHTGNDARKAFLQKFVLVQQEALLEIAVAMLWIVADDPAKIHRGSHITGQDHIIKLHDRTSLH